MYVYIICETHGTKALVGGGTLLEELECVTCIAEQDAARMLLNRPCCSRMNIDCCGHDESSAPYPLLASIFSPNFCDDRHLPEPPF